MMPEVIQGNYKIYTSKLGILKLTDNREKHGGIAYTLGYHILQ